MRNQDWTHKNPKDMSPEERAGVDLEARTEAQTLLRRLKGKTATMYALSKMLKETALEEFNAKNPEPKPAPESQHSDEDTLFRDGRRQPSALFDSEDYNGVD